MAKDNWTPFVPGTLPHLSDEEIRKRATALDIPFEVFRVHVTAMEQEETIWINNRYQVNVRTVTAKDPAMPPLTHLSIKRRDKAPIHDWRDLQRIKNELCGPECEGIEIYPAESRLVDTSNQFHIWVFEKGYRLPIGFNERLVFDKKGAAGTVQRPFDE